MIQANFRICEKSFEASVTGHARYSAGDGEDIVCSAASALVCSLLDFLEYEENHGRLRLNYSAMESGDIRFSANEIRGGRILGAFEVVICGFTLLCEKYPANVGCSVEYGE